MRKAVAGGGKGNLKNSIRKKTPKKAGFTKYLNPSKVSPGSKGSH